LTNNAFLGVCPNDCSGHGICSTINVASRYRGLDYDVTQANAGDGFGIVYKNWEANSMQLCECAPGYFGPDCSLGKLNPIPCNFYRTQIHLCFCD